jgi:endo-1,4-beta-xylanase
MHQAPTRHVRALAGSLFLIWSLTVGLAAPAAAQTVLQHGWEDGTLQGWTPFGGGVVLTNSTAAANSGSHSLLTTGRTAGFNGTSLEAGTLLAPGTNYQFTAFVRLAPGESPTQVRMTMRRTPSGGSAVFEQVAGDTAVSETGWAMVQGAYTFAGSASSLLV